MKTLKWLMGIVAISLIWASQVNAEIRVRWFETTAHGVSSSDHYTVRIERIDVVHRASVDYFNPATAKKERILYADYIDFGAAKEAARVLVVGHAITRGEPPDEADRLANQAVGVRRPHLLLDKIEIGFDVIHPYVANFTVAVRNSVALNPNYVLSLAIDLHIGILNALVPEEIIPIHAFLLPHDLILAESAAIKRKGDAQLVVEFKDSLVAQGVSKDRVRQAMSTFPQDLETARTQYPIEGMTGW